MASADTQQENSLQPYDHKKVNSANNLRELGNISSPKASSKELSSVNPLISKQRNQTSDLQDHEIIHLCYCKLLSMWSFVMTAVNYYNQSKLPPYFSRHIPVGLLN